MKKQFLLLLGIVFIGLNSCSQDLTCSDFKTGKFYIPIDNKLEKYTIESNDSISELKIDNDKNIRELIVIREKETQTEWKNGLNVGNPAHVIINWIDDCTYRLTYDGGKAGLNDENKWINDNNGIVVEKIRITGRCMEYRATMTTNDGQKISQNGTICKE